MHVQHHLFLRSCSQLIVKYILNGKSVAFKRDSVRMLNQEYLNVSKQFKENTSIMNSEPKHI